MENPNSELKNRILADIKTGQVNMKPRWKFFLQGAALALGLLLAVLLLLYFSSLVIFLLRLNGGWFAPGFGLRGLVVFLLSLPWLLVMAAFALLVVSEILASQYAFAYRRPVVYSVLGTVIVVIFGATLLNRTPFHFMLYRRAQNQTLPFAGRLYLQTTPPQDKICPGEIQTLTDNGFELSSNFGEIVTVEVTESTILPKEELNTGDSVVIFGQREGSNMSAEVIKRVERFYPPNIRWQRPKQIPGGMH
jgi:hypothetical protein